ncbi:interferon-inducible GTPase 5-like [Mercenaria mercenaria]|uniref:interferon-inducible GTPase 5-like n=1 Tax=Mercenaria mercenaria TaxID=6596 RepID=UPI00234EB195|nr:interferon-inducible GTPase 5-like [Mercenaria mercenaria]
MYAPVGPTETTFRAKSYPHPENKRLRFWDLPGIGTDAFPRNTYTKDGKIDFHSYDIYIILASDRFTEDETCLAETIEKAGKIFLFVRSRIDIHLDKCHDEEAVVTKIRKECQEKLKNRKIKSEDVFLISSKFLNRRCLDFERLLQRLLVSLPALKKEAVMFSLQFNTKEFIDAKEKALQSRILKLSLGSAVGGLVTIPGVSLLIDIILIAKELDFYRKTLCLTEMDLICLANKTKKTVEELKKEYNLKTFDTWAFANEDAAKLTTILGPIFKQISMSETVESSARLIPMVGSAIGAGMSFATTIYFLRSSLNMMVEDARKMIHILVVETGSRVFQPKGARR